MGTPVFISYTDTVSERKGTKVKLRLTPTTTSEEALAFSFDTDSTRLLKKFTPKARK